MENNERRLIKPCLAAIAVLAVLFIAGTFADEAISKAIFTPDSIPIKAVTSLGVLPYFFGVMLLFGSLTERTVHSSAPKAVKITVSVLLIAGVLFLGFIGGASFVDRNCLGSIFPSLDRNYPVIAIFAVVLFYPFVIAGYRLAAKSEDVHLLKRLIVLFAVMLTAFAIMQVVKHVFSRPRYRTVVLGYEGVGFEPWYKPFTGAGEAMERFGIDKEEFRSFPSGHGILSFSSVYILQMLTWYSAKLKEKRGVLLAAGLIFGSIIIITRVILGAHYVSDVTMGAMIALGLAIVFMVIQSKISDNSEDSMKE